MNRLFFVVNRLADTTPDQTTALLLAEAARRRPTFVFDVDDVSLRSSGRVRVRARRVPAHDSVADALATGFVYAVTVSAVAALLAIPAGRHLVRSREQAVTSAT